MSKLSVTWRQAAIAVAVASFVGGAAVGRAADAEKPWERSIAVGATVTSGNSDTMLFTGALKGDKIWKADELHLALLGAYGKDSNHDVNNETLQGIAQYNHLFSERLYSIVLVDALHDGIADLEYRVTVGPGVGYYFVKAEKTKFAGEIGGAFVEEKINPDPGAAYSQNYFTLRVADRFEHKFNDSAKVWQMTEWLPAVDDIASRYLLNTEVGAEAALTKAMSLRLVAAHRYNSQPAAGKKKYDLTLVASVAYKF